MDYSLPLSSIRGIFQARILKWVAISFCRGSSYPSDQTLVPGVSCIAGRLFTTSATWEAHPSDPHLLAGALTQSYNFHMLPTLFGGAPEVLQDLNAPGSYKVAFFPFPQNISIPRY